jgi:NAD(P)-dependent dehydrogenase (short-subunit alcohol dehydrogenase family)
MGGRLAGKVALVTGAGAGIGAAIALRFGREGAVVASTSRDPATAEATAATIREAGGEAIGVALDVTDRASVRDAIAEVEGRLGRIDVLVNNAGASTGAGPLEIDLETWDAMLRLNLTGVFLCAQAVLPGMLARGAGTIVTISSVNGLIGVGEEPYSAAKAAVVNLTQNLCVRYGARGIRANVICPGTIRTRNFTPRFEARPDLEGRIASWYPAGRIGEPEDVAAAALFLASDEAGFINGAMLPVDGGLTAGLPRMIADLAG